MVCILYYFLYIMAVIWLPKASPLFIDKLSMTLHIPEHEQQIVIHNFKQYLSGFMGGGLYPSKLYSYNRKLYLEGEQLFVQCGPKAKNTNFFRIEWNPAKMTTETVADVVNLTLPDGYADLISYGRITRIDITTDVKNLKMKDIRFRYPGMTIGYNYLKAGGIQTAYLGAKGGVNQFKFYDKKQQVKDNNAGKPKQYHEPLPEYQTTRIEWEYRPQEVCTFANITKACKPIYQKLWCGMVANLPEQPETIFDSLVCLVISDSLDKGLPQALYKVVEFKRAEVREFIEKNTHTLWWNPESLWETLPDTIEQIVNPVPNKWTILQ